MPIDELALEAAFVKTTNVPELRAALHLPPHLGKREADFLRSATLVFEHLGKATTSEHRCHPSTFCESWVDGFNRHLLDCRRVIVAALAG